MHIPSEISSSKAAMLKLSQKSVGTGLLTIKLEQGPDHWISDFGFWIFVVIEQRMSSEVSKSVCPCSTNFLSHYLPSARHRF